MSRHFSATLRAGFVLALILCSVDRLPAQDAPARVPQDAEAISTEFILGLASDPETYGLRDLRFLNYLIHSTCTTYEKKGLAELAKVEAQLNNGLERDVADLTKARQVWKEADTRGAVRATQAARADCTKKARSLAQTLYSNKWLTWCIRRRQGILRRGEAGLPVALGTEDRRLEATWVTGKCEGQYGAFEAADWKGGLSIILHPDGSAKGTIYGSPDSEGLVLTGTHRAGGYLEAFGPPTPSDVYARLEGKVAPAVSGEITAAGSGTLKYGGGGGPSSWTCYGTWSGH